jgi:hypothetical protein
VAYAKAKLRGMVIKDLLALDLSEKEMYQMFAYADLITHFI